MKKEYNCEFCGKFIIARSYQRFCCDNHRVNYFRDEKRVQAARDLCKKYLKGVNFGIQRIIPDCKRLPFYVHTSKKDFHAHNIVDLRKQLEKYDKNQLSINLK